MSTGFLVNLQTRLRVFFHVTTLSNRHAYCAPVSYLSSLRFVVTFCLLSAATTPTRPSPIGTKIAHCKPAALCTLLACCLLHTVLHAARAYSALRILLLALL